MEPSPRAMRWVPQILLLKYGWAHQEAGGRHPENEMSFRQTISAAGRSDRGFTVQVDRAERKVKISFDANAVGGRHSDWLKSVEERTGLAELDPQPYWGFDDLFHKAGTKLINCFYIVADRKREAGVEYFAYNQIKMLKQFSIEKFVRALEENWALVDFDARSGHNHGTKFRLKQNTLPELYEEATIIE